MPRHTVREGDCLSSIALRHGYGRWQTVWEHGPNGALRGRRSNANQLVPDDVVEVPDKTPEDFSVATDAVHTFRVTRAVTKLKLRLQNPKGEALAAAACSLEASSGSPTDATSDGDGVAEFDIAADLSSATLTVELPAGPARPTPPVDGSAVPTETFKLDTEPEDTPAVPPPPPPETPPPLRFSLTLGSLQPVAETKGAQQRLQNLGYPCNPDGIVGDETRAATRAFQRDAGKTPSGTLDGPTRAALESAHDRRA